MVSSGAIALGLGELGRLRRPRRLDELQAAAAIGQGTLQRAWRDALGEHGVATGQVLLTAAEVRSRAAYLNARGTLARLTAWGVVPIDNENDSTATDEITFGDNDALAAQVALLLGAELLVLLTDADGLYTRHPAEAGAELISEVSDHHLLAELDLDGGASSWGSGGMRSKVVAAEMASTGGVRSVIAAATEPDVLALAVAGAAVGTRFHATRTRKSAYKIWLRHGKPSLGTIVVDAGARRALVEQGASLLPVGVAEVRGNFAAGDAVDVADAEGNVFAKGVAELPSREITGLIGRRGERLVLHRDALVVWRDEPRPSRILP